MASKKNSVGLRLLLSAALLLLLPHPAPARVNPLAGKSFAITLSPSRYNRVEGFFTGAEVFISPAKWKGAGILGSGGYGFASKTWRYEAGLLLRRGSFTLSAATFNRTASLDDSLIDTRSNTFTALVAKRDYKDYFQAKDGVEVVASHRYRKVWLFRARVDFSTLRTMPVVTNWSVFRRDEPFRDNPTVEEGKEGMASVTVAYDRTAPNPFIRSGASVSGTYERRFRDFKDDGLRLEARRYQVMPFGNQTLVLRGMLASRTNLAPDDSLRLLYLGGYRTLRGFTFREFHGNRVIMANADYIFRNALRLVDLVLFFDTGWAGTRPPSASLVSGFGNAQWADFKSSAGVALALAGQMLRVDIARRLDRRHAGWVVTVVGGKSL